MVQETSNIQLLDVPDDVTKHELENFFSNASACGGGEIKDMYRIEYIPGCWIIEYLVATGKPYILSFVMPQPPPIKIRRSFFGYCLFLCFVCATILNPFVPATNKRVLGQIECHFWRNIFRVCTVS